MGETDLEILKSLSMYRKDYLTGEEGFTLSGILTFGKDEVIHGVLPYFAIDVLLRINDTERYDDRLRISTNLIDSYSQIMNFFAKYVSNPFYIRKDKRIELRDVLFREIIVNMLVHREYSNPFVSRVQITKNEINFKNANKPVHPGKLHHGEIRPYPKNPNIAHVFHILGLVEELGSGLRKIFELAPILLGGNPVVDNEDHFIVSLPINNSGLSNLSNQTTSDNNQIEHAYLSEEQQKVLSELDEPMSTRELFQLVSNGKRTSSNAFRTQIITPLLDMGLIRMTIPSKPKSPKQKYVRTNLNKK
ncbi:Fic family protein [Lactiplantibacillus plajomi]